MAWVDWDGRGKLDLSANNAVYSFAEGAWLPVQNIWGGFMNAWADVDNDGDPDLAVLDHDFTGVLENDGGSLRLDANRGLGWSFETTGSDLSWGDWDRDGDKDLALASDHALRVFENRDGVLQLNPPSVGWISPDAVGITSIAWADWDSDQDLDLAVGNTGFNFVLENGGDMFRLEPPTWGWISSDARETNSIKWGDWDSDGDLDLAVGNTGKDQVYENVDGGLQWDPANGLGWESTLISATRSLDWGDQERDGDLDLATSVDEGVTPILSYGVGTITRGYNQSNVRIYTNNGGTLAFDPENGIEWQSSSFGRIGDIAWSDWDGDGDPDLTVGWSSGVPVIFENVAGRLFPARDTGWPGNPPRGLVSSKKFAWGDWDVDGDLDLAFGGYFTRRIYENEANDLKLNPSGGYGWLAPQGTTDTRGIAWGDWDGDGDPDLAFANSGGPVQVFDTGLNSPGMESTSRGWHSAPVSDTTSIAWADPDSDGDLDLTATTKTRIYLFRNPRLKHDTWFDSSITGAVHRPGITDDAPLFSSSEIISSRFIPINYVLFGGPFERISRVQGYFSLDGGATWRPAIPVTTTVTTNLPVSPAPQGRAHVYIWDTLASGFLGASDSVVLRLDLTPANGPYQHARTSLYSPPFRVQGTQIRVLGQEGPPPTPLADSVVYHLQADKERRAEPLGGTGHPIRTTADGFLQNRAGMKVDPDENKSDRLVALWPSAEVTATTPTRLYASNNTFPMTTAVSFSPIRSHLVISDARRIAAINVWVDISATLPISVAFNLVSPRGDRVTLLDGLLPAGESLCVADELGHPCGATARRIFTPTLSAPQNPLADGTWILEASAVVTEPVQLMGWGLALKLSPLNFTSARPIDTGLLSLPITTTGVQTLTVNTENPLLLFDLNVALEWNASNDEHYKDQLGADMQHTSELLYDWSNGQVALGNVRVYQDARHNLLPDGSNAWNDADIRIYASNRLRPNADQGGIVSQVITDTVQKPQETDKHTLVFAPGQVRMGAEWNRHGEAGGNLGDDWARAFAHELGHYLLFLDDNYIGLDSESKTLVTISDAECPGAMNNPYSDLQSEFHPVEGWASEPVSPDEKTCRNTFSYQNSYRSDWETIKHFYPWLFAPGVAITKMNPGPSLLPLAVTQVAFVDALSPSLAPKLAAPITPKAPLETPIFYLYKGNKPYRTSNQARAFLLQQFPDAAPERSRSAGGRSRVRPRGAAH